MNDYAILVRGLHLQVYVQTRSTVESHCNKKYS